MLGEAAGDEPPEEGDGDSGEEAEQEPEHRHGHADRHRHGFHVQLHLFPGRAPTGLRPRLLSIPGETRRKQLREWRPRGFLCCVQPEHGITMMPL